MTPLSLQNNALQLSVALMLGAAAITPGAFAQDTTAPVAPATPPITTTAPLPPPATTEPVPADTSPKSGTKAASSGNTDNSRRFSFGPEVGVYLPTNSKTRSAFGSTWFNIGLGIGGIPQASHSGRLQFDLGLLGTSKADRQILIAPIGLSYIHALSQSTDGGPYAGISGDVFLTQLRSDSEGILSRIRGTAGGSAFVGTAFGQRGYIQARYYLLGNIRGYNLSGLNLSTGYRF
jgi:hypothetical protein